MKALFQVGLFLCLLGVQAGTGSVLAQTPPAGAFTKQTTATATPRPAPHKAPAKARHNAMAAPEPLRATKLDLSLPADMVKGLKPATQDSITTPKPLLPYLFGEKPPADSPFQLNGRLLSNEMQLQLRNDARQDIEGAAIEFEFKQ